MSGAGGDDLGGTDPIELQVPRGATGSSRMPTTKQSTPQSTASVTRVINTKSFLQVTPYHGDKASFLGWKSVAILAQAISCSNVRIIFLRNEFCLVLSCPSVYYPVFYFPTCSQAPRYFVTTRAWIRRFWQPRQDHQWSRGGCHFQNNQCWKDR